MIDMLAKSLAPNHIHYETNLSEEVDLNFLY